MKILIVILAIIAVSFIVPNIVHAKGDDGIGGKLLEPIVDLVVAISDGFLNILHKVVVGQSDAFLTVERSSQTLKVILTVFVAIVAAAVAVALVIFTAGAAAALLGPALASIGVTIGSLSAGAILTAAAIGATAGAVYFYNADFFKNDLHLSIATVTVDKIFSNEIPLFDVDFFNPKGEEITLSDGSKSIGKKVKLKNGKEVEVESTAYKLQKTISDWYNTLRYIALVVMLSVLVYIGIRITISSTAGDKAKYKQMIMDWIVAMCLLFIMQYIMSFSNIIVNKITDVVKSTAPKDQYMELAIQKDDEFKVLDTIAKYELGGDASDDEIKDEVKKLEDSIVVDMGDAELIVWDTDFLGYARFEADMAKSGNASYAGFAILYAVLVAFTWFFSITYIKRVIYMAFLTIISPLVALTYPIDKINDGKAQAFDMWLKEYIFNLLIQPLHLLLYTILITSAFNLASQNIIYALVAIGFMIPAEKLMRRFFGFEKAQTPGLLAGPAGAALAMSGVNKLLSKGGHSKGKDGSKGSSNSKDGNDNASIKTKKDLDTGEAFEKKLGNGKDSDTITGGESDLDEGKTDAQKMSDADYEENWLGADQAELQTLDANAREAYGNEKGMQYSSEEMENILRDSGYSEDEIKQKMNDWYGNEDKGNNEPSNNHSLEDGNNKDNDTFGKRYMNYIKDNGGRALKAANRAKRYYAKGMQNKLSNAVRNFHPVKRGIRVAGGLATGAVAGGLGLAAGIVSGDPSKAFQYTAAGAMGGYKLGKNTTNSAVNTLKVEGTKEAFEKEYYGKDEYQDRQIQKNVKEMKRDNELRMKLEEKLGSKEKAKKYIEEEIPEYIKYGISDKNTIIAMTQLQEKGMERNEAISAALISEKYLDNKDSNSLSQKSSKEFRDTINRDGEKRNLHGKDLEKFSNNVIESIGKLDKIRYK